MYSIGEAIVIVMGLVVVNL